MHSASSRQVLIVDDEDCIRKLLSDFFSFNGYKVTLASNGEEALDKLKNKPCSILITDLSMPLMDGIKLVTEIRNLNIPLTIIGMSFEDKASEFLKAGADYFLLKPFKFNNLKSILKSIPSEE
jgi:DNA-binding response OmpR family regulator